MSAEPGRWWRRVAWLIVIWAVSVASLAAVSGILRFWLAPSK